MWGWPWYAWLVDTLACINQKMCNCRLHIEPWSSISSPGHPDFQGAIVTKWWVVVLVEVELLPVVAVISTTLAVCCTSQLGSLPRPEAAVKEGISYSRTVGRRRCARYKAIICISNGCWGGNCDFADVEGKAPISSNWVKIFVPNQCAFLYSLNLYGRVLRLMFEV